MPISPKRVVETIRSFTVPFSRDALIAELDRFARLPEKSGRKRTGNARSGKDLSRIDETLKALTSLGFLEKNRKSYRISRDFSCRGTISVDRRGAGVLVTENGNEFLIEAGDTAHAHSGDYVEAELTAYKKGYFLARVVRLIKRKKDRYIAQVMRPDRGHNYYRLLDIPGKIEACSLRFEGEPRPGTLSVVELTGKIRQGLSECRVVESFEPEDELQDFKRISVRHNLPGPHPRYAELAEFGKKHITREKKGRKDYRSLFTITIDGENAKDFDDAISLENTGGVYRLYVHIADVSAFVQKGSELDREAEKRATSFYLGNQVIPMLPEKLSNDLCSLKEGEERLCLTAEITLGNDGAVVQQEYFRGIIKSDRRLTYTGAHALIVSGKRSKLAATLREMYQLASRLKDRRMKQGRVDLNLTDSEFIYEGNALIDLIEVQRLKSHLIVEEFMLTANEVVSRTLREKKIPALYRIHEPISEEKLGVLIKFLRTLGISINMKIPRGNALQAVIESVRGKEYEEVVNFIILKSFMQAYYGIEPAGHFGLGFRDYTHFTSPIRRYPDLVVHRCIKNLITGTPAPYRTEELAPIGEKSSTMERLAQSAERDLFRLKSCRLMSSRIGESFDAVISGISKYGFFVTLMEKPIEGMVPLRFLTDDFYLVQEDEYTVIGRRLGRRFRLGDRIKVKLVSVEIETMRIDFAVS